MKLFDFRLSMFEFLHLHHFNSTLWSLTLIYKRDYLQFINWFGLISLLFFSFKGGAIVRAAKKLAERVGFDMETGLHLPQPPQKEEPENLEDCKYHFKIHTIFMIFISSHWSNRFVNSCFKQLLCWSLFTENVSKLIPLLFL